jgi:hypothetical protein
MNSENWKRFHSGCKVISMNDVKVGAFIFCHLPLFLSFRKTDAISSCACSLFLVRKSRHGS